MSDERHRWGAILVVVSGRRGAIAHHAPDYHPGDGPLVRTACGVEDEGVVFEFGHRLPRMAACPRCFLDLPGTQPKGGRSRAH